MSNMIIYNLILINQYKKLNKNSTSLHQENKILIEYIYFMNCYVNKNRKGYKYVYFYNYPVSNALQACICFKIVHLA